MNESVLNAPRSTFGGRIPAIGMAIYQDVAPTKDSVDRYYNLAEMLERRGTLKCAFFRKPASTRPLATAVGPGVRLMDLAYGFAGNILRLQGLRQRRERFYDRFVSARWRTIRPDLVVCNYQAPFTRAAINDWNARVVFLDKNCLQLRKWSESGDAEADARAWRAGKLAVNFSDRFRLACDHVITMAEQDLPWYRAFGVPATFTPNGIDVAHWKNQANKHTVDRERFPDYAAPPQELRWLGIGSAPDRKNLMLLLGAWEKARCPGILSVVGVPDTREWREKLGPLISRLGDTLKVHFGRQAMAPHFASADVLVLPTRAEGAPRVVLEAACFGVPALTTLPGRGGFVEDGRTGWLLEPITVDGLAERIASLAKVPAHVHHVGATAALVIEEFDVYQYASRIADAIDIVIKTERS